MKEQNTRPTHGSDSTHVFVSLACCGAACVGLQLRDDVHQPPVLHALDPASRTRLDLDGRCSFSHVLGASGVVKGFWYTLKVFKNARHCYSCVCQEEIKHLSVPLPWPALTPPPLTCALPCLVSTSVWWWPPCAWSWSGSCGCTCARVFVSLFRRQTGGRRGASPCRQPARPGRRSWCGQTWTCLHPKTVTKV